MLLVLYKTKLSKGQMQGSDEMLLFKGLLAQMKCSCLNQMLLSKGQMKGSDEMLLSKI